MHDWQATAAGLGVSVHAADSGNCMHDSRCHGSSLGSMHMTGGATRPSVVQTGHMPPDLVPQGGSLCARTVF